MPRGWGSAPCSRRGRRTVTAALRALGLSGERRFERYHRVRNQACWPGLRGSQILLGLLIVLLPPGVPIVIAVDETTLPRSSAWTLKPDATFSDCLALVRRRAWRGACFDS